MSTRSLLAATGFLAALAVPLVAEASAAQVTGNVNLRTGPGVGYARIATLPAGAVVDVGACSGNWCPVAYGNLQGWASLSYLAVNRGYNPPPSPPPAYYPPPRPGPGPGYGYRMWDHRYGPIYVPGYGYLNPSDDAYWRYYRGYPQSGVTLNFGF